MIGKILLAVGVLTGALALSPIGVASGDGVSPVTPSPALADLPPLHFRLPPDVNGKFAPLPQVPAAYNVAPPVVGSAQAAEAVALVMSDPRINTLANNVPFSVTSQAPWKSGLASGLATGGASDTATQPGNDGSEVTVTFSSPVSAQTFTPFPAIVYAGSIPVTTTVVEQVFNVTTVEVLVSFSLNAIMSIQPSNPDAYTYVNPSGNTTYPSTGE